MSVELSTTRMPKRIADATVKDSLQLIRATLEASGFAGLWSVSACQQITMRTGEVRIGTVRGKAVILKIRPGNNTTAWEWECVPPSSLTPEAAHTLLMQKHGDPERPATLPRFTETTLQDLHGRAVGLEVEDKRAAPTSGILQAAPPTGLPGDTGEISTLVRRLGVAGARAKEWRARAAKLEECKAELDRAEVVILKAQESYDGARQAYDQLRGQHVADDKGREADMFLTTLKGLG